MCRKDGGCCGRGSRPKGRASRRPLRPPSAEPARWATLFRDEPTTNRLGEQMGTSRGCVPTSSARIRVVAPRAEVSDTATEMCDGVKVHSHHDRNVSEHSAADAGFAGVGRSGRPQERPDRSHHVPRSGTDFGRQWRRRESNPRKVPRATAADETRSAPRQARATRRAHQWFRLAPAQARQQP
jgi:hypothetical protein